MSQDLGFSYTVRKSGEIAIARHGKTVTVLRGDAAVRFQKKLKHQDGQQLMARATGNYKRGNER